MTVGKIGKFIPHDEDTVLNKVAHIDKSTPCGCRILNNKLQVECQFHKAGGIALMKKTALFIEAKINNILKETFLVEIRQRIGSEFKKIHGNIK